MLFADAKEMTEDIVKFRLMKTKIFCDIADYESQIFNKKSIVDGFTTNPSNEIS